MTTQPTQTQFRLMDRLLAAIAAIAEAIYPIVQTIEKRRHRPWIERHTFTTRFWAIFRELIALPIRITPNILSQNPTFKTHLPRNPQAEVKPERATPIPRGSYGPRYACKTPFTARQLAQRLLAILQKLEALAAEAAATLPPRLRHHAEKAKALAGCNALPLPYPTWERAG